MSRTRSIASCTSRWVRPAMASSSSSTFGSVASARAISSRLRPGVPSERAGASASRLMPTRSSTARALVSASVRCEVRRNAPIITFSSTVMPSKVCGTWKVRARPRCARASGVMVGDIVAFEQHLARGRDEIAGQAVEEGGLAGAVRADEAENVALLQRHAGGIDGLEAAKGFGHVARFKEHWMLLRQPRVLASCLGVLRFAHSRLISARMPPGWKRAMMHDDRAVDARR